jgi:hypothetical protein
MSIARTLSIAYSIQPNGSFVWWYDKLRHGAALKKLIGCVLRPLPTLFLFRASFNRYMQSVGQWIAVSKVASQIDNIVLYVG